MESNNESLLKIAIVSSLSSLLVGIVALYITIWYLKNKILNKYKYKWNDNLFFPILMIGAIIGIGVLVSAISQSILTTLKIASRNGTDFYLEVFKFISLSSLAIILFVFIINVMSNFLIQSIFGKTNMEDELKESKYSFALIYSSCFIAFCFVLKDSLSSLFELLIPFESINF